jgi:hypothetical protein
MASMDISSVTAFKQAQVQQQASFKVAKIALDAESAQGAQIAQLLVKAASTQSAAASAKLADGCVDCVG